jgi:fucose 4-O-acetylase-like acetyltransferase
MVGLKFENLLYPYLIWTFIQITLQIGLSSVTNSNRTLMDYAYILYQPRNLDQFWYLPALFNATVIYLLLKHRFRIQSGMQLLIGLILYFISPYFQAISMISDWMAFYFFFALGDAINQIFFKEATQKFFRNPLSLLLVIPVFILAQRYYLQNDLANLGANDTAHLSRPDYFNHIRDQVDFLFIALIGCLSIFILAFRLQTMRIFAFLRVLGFHSLYIYVMHVIITAFTRLSLIVLFHITNPYILLFTSIVVGVILPVIIYNLFVKDGPAWFLFTYKRPKPNTSASLQAVSRNDDVTVPDSKAKVMLTSTGSRGDS